MTLHEELARARKRLGASQEEMAEKVGVSQVSISSWESDDDKTRVSPRPSRLDDIARAYRLDSDLVWSLWRRAAKSRAA